MNTERNYIKAYLIYAIQELKLRLINKTTRARNKLALIRLICKCRNNHYILLIHTFAKGLTEKKVESVPEE